MKWCVTPTLFRGLHVYIISAQGMPGSSETLEEMVCSVLAYSFQEGCVAKIADDLYVGGNMTEGLYHNWSGVLYALHHNSLKLKASKTFIAFTHAQILGWDLNNGTISASSHKLFSSGIM